ncbi:MAG: lipid A deacylase LpxR family protein [Cyclobacteriaceae bacterium]|nr:lipid A deacylase LpxR family protein [Cyclobacteriaceae bacterium]
MKTVSNEISLTVDNDVLFFSDYYYTAGHELAYRKLQSEQKNLVKWLNRKNISSKVISSIKFGSKIFNPRKTTFVGTLNMDRPYAGYTYLGYSISRLRKRSSVTILEFELGLVGKATRLGQVQQWWHKQIGYDAPRGWDSQISNELIFNIGYQFQRSIKISKEIDLVSSTGLFAGTGSNKISQDITLRLVDFRPLAQSVFSSSLLGYEGDRSKEEVFLFFGCGVDYVVSNIFLDGSLFNSNPSPYTVDSNSWVFKKNFGIMYAKKRGSFAFSIINMGKEMEDGTRHSYASLKFSQRF